MKKIFYTILFLTTINFVISQELICDVSVSAPDVTKVSADPKTFKTLENQIREFMNNTKWTSETYGENEKIECSLFIAIKSQTGNTFSGTFTLVSKRPVFNSNYNTTVLNIIDNDIKFSYKEFEPIEISEGQFVTNLSHLLAFYANIIIGMDNETFAKEGGEVYLQKAQDLVNLASTTSYTGWKSRDKNKRSRYWLITSLMNPRYSTFREAQYTYYRLGLDNFYNDEKLARQNIKAALELLAKVSLDDPNITIIQMWNETKQQEVIDIYKSAPQDEKTAIVNILRKVDPVNANKYKVISK